MPRMNRLVSLWKFYVEEDLNRTIFSFKFGLAILLVSLFILLRSPYEFFGSNIIWALFTTSIMFEYTVGMTFDKGFNRITGCLLAGVLGIATAQVTIHAGRIAEPIIIGLTIFLIGASTSLLKIWPSVKYEYALRVTSFNYSLIILFGYRMGNPLKVALDRVWSVAIGGAVVVLVNVFIYPVWAGEELHKKLANNFSVLADSLEECVQKYIETARPDNVDFLRTACDNFPDEPAYEKCKNTLNSYNELQALANSAKWEPPHGRFRRFSYPWSEYVKVASVLRHCAYEVMALHGVLHSEIQAPYNLRKMFKQDISDVTEKAAALLRSLGNDIGKMKRSYQISTPLIEQIHSSSDHLQWELCTHSYLFIRPIVSKSPHPRPGDNESSIADHHTQNINMFVMSYHEMMRKKHSMTKTRTLQSTAAALSFASFTSLLIEFVARLDHLVEAVDELSRLAKFNTHATQLLP